MANGTLAVRETQGGMAQRLKEAMPRLQATLPRHFTPEKMVELLNVLCFRTPDLQRCDPESVITAAIQAGSLDLDLNPVLNEAFIVPKGGIAVFWPGYKGLEKLAIRTGTVLYIQAREVCESDVLRVVHDPDTSVIHEINYQGKRGAITHIYAVAEMVNGKQMVEVMSFEEIEAIRKRSQMANSGPWRNDWKEMGCKTLVKRICKRLPRGGDPGKGKAFDALNAAIEADNSHYDALDAPPEHHALNHDNATGHGSGAYASPDDVQAYREWLKGFHGKINAAWLDRVTARMEPADVPNGYGELLSIWQLSGHLCKFAKESGMISAPDEPRSSQTDKFAAVAWLRKPEAVKEEAKRYCKGIFAVKWEKLFPPEQEPVQAPPVPAEDASQDDGDPDDDLPDDF